MQPFMYRAIAWLSLAIGPTLCQASSADAAGGPSKRPFTIKDSIEISRIVETDAWTKLASQGERNAGKPIFSPDRRYFLLVTQRGNLKSDTLEGTIWLFNTQDVEAYVIGGSRLKPIPKKLVSVGATSDTPVIEDVRWIDGSQEIAFLGKSGNPNQRLFMVDVPGGAIRAVTEEEQFVTAYDVRGDTIAFTVLERKPPKEVIDGEVVVIEEKKLWELLYGKIPGTAENLVWGDKLNTYPSSLHIWKSGKDAGRTFLSGGKELRLFVPTLALSPDAKWVVTVAPVYQVPKPWEQHRANPLTPFLNWPSLEKHTGDINVAPFGWRPEQYVIINLETNEVEPLIDAPAGRDLGYGGIGTEAFWADRGERVIVTNTYMPLRKGREGQASLEMTGEGPVAALIDASTRTIQSTIALTSRAAAGEVGGQGREAQQIDWDGETQELTLEFQPGVTSSRETYAVRERGWEKNDGAEGRMRVGAGPTPRVVITVREDLNHAPALWAKHADTGAPLKIWDPNPQLESLGMGQASAYQWTDVKGRAWRGILVLPDGYDPKKRYPLVIQTHGYEPSRFFADGEFTTGSGGRALVANDIVVLQEMNMFLHFSSPEEGSDNLLGFEAAVRKLTKQGVIDPKRVGVIGFSRTCFHVLYALERRPELFSAAAITDGLNFSYFEYMILVNDPALTEIRRQEEAVYGGAPFGKSFANWASRATDMNLDKIQAPLLIGSLGKTSILFQWGIYSGLQGLGKPVEMRWGRNENMPHLLVQPAQRYASQQSAVDWFCFWLKGEERTEPSAEAGETPETLRAQYSRWRELRKVH